MKKWVCQKNKEHVFDEYDPDPDHPYYCTLDEYPLIGILRLEEADVKESEPEREPDPEPILTKEEEEEEREVGLCVIMMDASDSMTDIAFEGIPLTRLTLVANSASSGIFGLEKFQNNSNAFVACFKFDDRVELMFIDTIGNIIKRHKNITAFSKYLYNELIEMQQTPHGTDINKALQQAYIFINQFLNRQLQGFPIKNYTPIVQRIFKYGLEDSVSVPNVRVLMYTDGRQYVVNGSMVLNPNPFKQNVLNGLNHDVLIAAYFGAESDPGCKELRKIVSSCPIHNVPQFFLFNDPANIGNLNYLFRMASGASGFCPGCLEKQLKR
jgi:hypothetical protein